MGVSKYTKRCFVPWCFNMRMGVVPFTLVPSEEYKRKLWFEAVGRFDAGKVSLKTKFHCCIDHFDVSTLVLFNKLHVHY